MKKIYEPKRQKNQPLKIGEHGFSDVVYALLYCRDSGDDRFEIMSKRGAELCKEYLDMLDYTLDGVDEVAGEEDAKIIRRQIAWMEDVINTSLADYLDDRWWGEDR